jgi:hypothetical protein
MTSEVGTADATFTVAPRSSRRELSHQPARVADHLTRYEHLSLKRRHVAGEEFVTEEAGDAAVLKELSDSHYTTFILGGLYYDETFRGQIAIYIDRALTLLLVPVHEGNVAVGTHFDRVFKYAFALRTRAHFVAPPGSVVVGLALNA